MSVLLERLQNIERPPSAAALRSGSLKGSATVSMPNLLWLPLIGCLLLAACTAPSDPITLVGMVEDGSRPYGVAFLDNDHLAIVGRCESPCSTEVKTASLKNPLLPRFAPLYGFWLDLSFRSKPTINVDSHSVIFPAFLDNNNLVFPRPSGTWPNLGIKRISLNDNSREKPLSFRDPRPTNYDRPAIFAVYPVRGQDKIVIDIGDSDCVFVVRIDDIQDGGELSEGHAHCTDKAIDCAKYRSRYVASLDRTYGAFVNESRQMGGPTILSVGNMKDESSKNILTNNGPVHDVLLLRNNIVMVHESYNPHQEFANLTKQFKGISILDVKNRKARSKSFNDVRSSMIRPILLYCIKRNGGMNLNIETITDIINIVSTQTWVDDRYNYLGSSPDASRAAFRRGNRIYVYDLSQLEC